MHINAVIFAIVSVCLAILAFATHGEISLLGRSGAIAERISLGLEEGGTGAARVGRASRDLGTLGTGFDSSRIGLDSFATRTDPFATRFDRFATGSGFLEKGRLFRPESQWRLTGELKPSATCGAPGALIGWKVNPESGLASFGACRTFHELNAR